ncbi:MAG TPA: BON domain-containing protein [Acidimicrobiales bacterium]|nr:BON domain-containing protein [Acidimicrobiales bacterium]
MRHGSHLDLDMARIDAASGRRAKARRRRNRTRRRLGAIGLGLGIAMLARSRWGRQQMSAALGVTIRQARYELGRLEGLRYRLSGRHPDLAVTGAVLADRVRSEIGAVEHRLDIPHVHVMAQGHDVILHGEVDTAEHAAEVEVAVAMVPGVRHVDSRLRVGLTAGDTRPSEGAARHPQSEAMHRLLAAAHGGGATPGTERAAARSILSTFVDILPAGERRHVLGHLPADVRALADSSVWVERRPLRHLEEFSVAALPMVAPETRRTVVESVLGAVRELVPEEAEDVAAVLSGEMRRVWKTAIPL